MAGGYYAPVAGSYTQTSGFTGGFRSSGGHSGIDFAAPAGTAVRAVAPGVVISSGWGGAYGNLVMVRHADGSIGYYAHNSRNAVKVGQRVGRGSLLGYVGSTGNSTGPHSHFEVRRGGRPVDPNPWLRGDYSASGTVSNAQRQPGAYAGVRLSSEQLRNAQTIIQVGLSMGANQRDLTIAIMTAMQESTLRNLNYGDRDSLGLFQQRAGWGSAGQRTNPRYAAAKFFEALLKIRNRGSMRLTEAAQAVQRSAFPNAYARWEELARAVVGNPGGGSYFVGGYDQYYQTQQTMWNDPSEVFASLGLAQPNRELSAFGSPTEGMDSGVAGGMGESATGTMIPSRSDAQFAVDEDFAEEPDFEWGDFSEGGTVTTQTAARPAAAARTSAPTFRRRRPASTAKPYGAQE